MTQASLWNRFASCTSGHFAVIFALAVPVLLTALGSAIDYTLFMSMKSRAQAAADAAAIAGAKSLTMADTRSGNVSAVVEAVVKDYLSKGGLKDVATGLTVTAEAHSGTSEPLKVTVSVAGPVKGLFAKPFGFGSWTVDVRSSAMVVGTPNVCLLALDGSAMGTIYLEKTAKVVGQNCAVYSNSTHPDGIKAFNSSQLNANLICSAGGKVGGKGNFVPDPLVDCPQFADPLAGRPAPTVGGCAATNLVIDSRSVMLAPGTYCGGVQIIGNAVVTFETGTYVMSEGPLIVADTAVVKGSEVGFYFSGAAAGFTFGTDTTIDFSAPENGIMAGLLFYGDPAQNGTPYAILSDHAHQLLGTIYLPQGVLTIDANQPIADRSAYTAIVARQVRANSGPTVMLNTNYEQTTVPVPDGIRGVGQGITLVK